MLTFICNTNDANADDDPTANTYTNDADMCTVIALTQVC